MGVGGQGVHILLQGGDEALGLLDLLREVTQHIVLHAELPALVIRLEDFQPGHVDVQVHFLLDKGVPGAQGLDLGIGQGGFVHVVAGAHRGFGGHNLGNELLLILHRLPQIAVEGALGDIAVDVNLLVAVALPGDAALALLQVAGPPGTVQIV